METLFDPIRKKEVKRTPEEVVRQDTLNWLLNELLVPVHAIDIEVSLSRFKPGSSDRLDILVTRFNTQSAQPQYQLLVECKRPEVALDQDAILQVQKYLAVVPAEYVMITNGVSVVYLKRSENRYVQVKALPQSLNSEDS